MTTVKLRSENGMTLFAVLAIMAIFAVGLLAVAPSVVQKVQRDKELEAISRGEQVAAAIKQYVEFYGGAKLPNSMDDLLEGLPQGTKKRMILRESAAIDPLSEDGKWRLIKPDPQLIGKFARRVQNYNGGVLPPNPSPLFDRYAVVIVNNVNTGAAGDEEEDASAAEEEFEVVTENTPFIGVASQSKMRSFIAYYGIENHSKWIFTPLFRGASRTQGGNFNPAGAALPGAGVPRGK